jgi:hypothetical protein
MLGDTQFDEKADLLKYLAEASGMHKKDVKRYLGAGKHTVNGILCVHIPCTQHFRWLRRGGGRCSFASRMLWICM